MKLLTNIKQAITGETRILKIQLEGYKQKRHKLSCAIESHICQLEGIRIGRMNPDICQALMETTKQTIRELEKELIRIDNLALSIQEQLA